MVAVTSIPAARTDDCMEEGRKPLMNTMMTFFHKPYRWAAVYGALLILFFAFGLLDAFVIPKALMKVTDPRAPKDQAEPIAESKSEETRIGEKQTEITELSTPVITATSYQDENISITIETVRENNTTFYVADIQLSDATLLRTAFAQNTYGRNIKQTTSDMAAENGAIFAINGDYYGFRDYGYVLKNGVLYRDTSSGEDALLIDAYGDFSIVDEDKLNAQTLGDAWQVLSFGPALVVNGQLQVSEASEVSGKSMNSNPRTAIGQAGPLHYIVIVSDGRTNMDAGLSLHQLAQEMVERGCATAYNLDGGGSSCMVFNGQVINTTVGGRGASEREVSDIVYIGYE